MYINLQGKKNKEASNYLQDVPFEYKYTHTHTHTPNVDLFIYKQKKAPKQTNPEAKPNRTKF